MPAGVPTVRVPSLVPQIPVTDESVLHHLKESTETGRRSLGGAGISEFPTRGRL
jgi:hypothetical protein